MKRYRERDNYIMMMMMQSTKKHSGDSVKCAMCGSTDGLRRCLQCLSVVYCSRDCQAKHWSSHRDVCVRRDDCRPILNFDFGGGYLYTCGSGMYGLQGNASEDDVATFSLVEPLRNTRLRCVAMGSAHTLCATHAGEVCVYGSNDFGQLGVGGGDVQLEPTSLASLSTKVVSCVAAGSAFSAVALDTGQSLTFGEGSSGQLGVNVAERSTAALPPGTPRWDTDDHSSPKLVKELSGKNVYISSLTCGDAHILFLSAAGQLFACGDGSRGQLGLGMLADRPICVPTLVHSLLAMPVSGVGAGSYHSICVTATGDLYTWGASGRGACGHGTNTTEVSPRRVVGTGGQCADVQFLSVAAGGETSAAIDCNGTLYMWGCNSHGQIGDNDKLDHFAPYCLPAEAFNNEPVFRVACGVDHTVAVTIVAERQHHVYAWGSGQMGQLGIGDRQDYRTPQVVPLNAGRDASKREAQLETTVHTSDRPFVIIDVQCGSQVTGLVVARVSAQTFKHRPLSVDTSVDVQSPSAVLLRQRETTPRVSGNENANDDDAVEEAMIEDTGVSVVEWSTLPSISEPIFTSTDKLAVDNVEPDNDSDGVAHDDDMGDDDDGRGGGDDENLKPLYPVAPRIFLTMPDRKQPLSSFNYSMFIYHLRHSRLTNSFNAFALYVKEVMSLTALNGSFYPVRPPPAPASMSHNLVTSSQAALTTLGLLDDQAYAHQQWNTYRYGVDFMMIERFYKTLLSLHQPIFPQVLVNSIQRVLSELRNGVDKLMNGAPYTIRLCIVAMQYPLLARAGSTEIALLGDIANIIKRMSAQHQEFFVNQLAFGCPSDILQSRFAGTLVAAIQNLLKNCRQLRCEEAKNDIQNMMSLLSLVFEANKKRTFKAHEETLNELYGGLDGDRLVLTSDMGALDDSAFYVANIGAHVDLVHDYAVWARFITNPPSQSQLPPFTFCNYSFVFDPQTKANILRVEHMITSASLQVQSMFPVVMMQVRRDHLLEDGQAALFNTDPNLLKRRLMVRFAGEEGVDAGGVKVEFLRLFIGKLMEKQVGLFDYNVEQRSYFYNRSPADPEKLNLYRVLGVAMGLAFFNGIEIGINFALTFYQHILEMSATLADVGVLDQQVARSLQSILDFDGEVEDVFCLNFTASVPVDQQGNMQVVELITGGEDIAVTNNNRVDYVVKYVEFWLRKSVEAQHEALMEGFKSICSGVAFSHLQFSPTDLELILSGNEELDFRGLQEATVYEGFTKDHRIVKDFWSIVHNDLSDEEKRKFLTFCTGTHRAPLGGLKNLRLVIQRAGPDSDMVPSAHVCFNTLILPEYSSRQKLKSKLRIAVAHCEGFGLQ